MMGKIGEIKNKYGELLEDFLHEANTKELIIVCHGFNSDMEDRFIKGISSSLNKKGYNVYRFNFSKYPKCGGILHSSLTEQTSDLKSIIDYFISRKYTIKCVIGHSTGGTVVILRAACDNRIKSIALLSPRINLSKSKITEKIEAKFGKTLKELLLIKDGVTYPMEVEIKGELHYFSKKYVEDLAWLNVIDKLKQIKVPILILHGDEDVIVEINEGGRAARANKKAIFFPIVNADHSFTEYSENVSGVISDWLDHLFKFKFKRVWANFCFKFKHSLLCPTIKKLILILLVIFIFVLYFTLPPEFLLLQIDQPLNESTEIMVWWAILTVISMLTLNYISFINRLKNRYEDDRKRAEKEWDFKVEKKLREISWVSTLLAWSVFFMFITIGAVVFKIFYSYTPLLFDSYIGPWLQVCPQEFFQRINGVILYSFTISTVLRFYAFLDSYWEELLKYPFWFDHYRSRGKGKILRFVFNLVVKLKKK